MPYLRRSYLLSPDLEDAFVGELWAAGTLGAEARPGPDGRLRLDAYFPFEPGTAAPPPPGVALVSDEVVPDADWLAAWRERSQPFPLGESFFVDPREPDAPPAEPLPGRRLLCLPARAAFGTGSHESTRLAVELLEELGLAARRVLDIGTGTGVLAFAALARGAAEAVAFDLDPAASFHARANATLNHLRPRLFAGPIAALRESPRFDLALVNMVPEELLPELPAIVRRLAAKGEAVLSGIPCERGEEVLKRAQGLSLVERARREAGEWIAFRMELGPGREGE